MVPFPETEKKKKKVSEQTRPLIPPISMRCLTHRLFSVSINPQILDILCLNTITYIKIGKLHWWCIRA